MKKLFILCLSILFIVCGCSSNSSNNSSNVEVNKNIVNEIKDKGTIVVGVKTDVPELGYYDESTNNYSGLEIELAYHVAMEIFNCTYDESASYVTFVPVTVDNREEKLLNGDIDLMLATYTITDERKEKFALSNSYYTSYIGLMVRNSGATDDNESLGSNDIKSILDLDGKYIGVPKNATTRKDFIEYLEINKVNVTPIFNEYSSYEQLYKALMDKKIDVMSVDVSILNGYNTSNTLILKDRFAGQKYGAATTLENQKLIEVVNTAIENYQANE